MITINTMEIAAMKVPRRNQRCLEVAASHRNLDHHISFVRQLDCNTHTTIVGFGYKTIMGLSKSAITISQLWAQLSQWVLEPHEISTHN
jgi:hypothetical protein